MTAPAKFHETAHLQLDGMSCASCVARVERSLKAVPGVTSASANFGTGLATVGFDAPATRGQMAEALAKIGYPVKPQVVELAVEGMTCASCTGRVERVLRADPAVASATANLALRRAQVTLWEPADPARLAAAVTRAGFAAQPLAEARPADPQAEESHLWRKAALACLLAAPVFVAEMGGHLYPPFHHWLYGAIGQRPFWLMEFALATLALVGPGQVFFRKGIPALLRGAPDMNALVAMGTLAAWIFSSLELRGLRRPGHGADEAPAPRRPGLRRASSLKDPPARHTGWRYAVDLLVAAGAAPPEQTATVGDLHAWLRRELPGCTRPLKHAGNFRYLFGLTPAVKKRLPVSLPYPKVTVPR